MKAKDDFIALVYCKYCKRSVILIIDKLDLEKLQTDFCNDTSCEEEWKELYE